MAERFSGRPQPHGEGAADVATLRRDAGRIALAGVMVVLATVRFRRTSAAIDSPEKRPSTGVRMDIGLVILLLIFGGALFGYMAYTVLDDFT